jgi:hypothetical protein
MWVAGIWAHIREVGGSSGAAAHICDDVALVVGPCGLGDGLDPADLFHEPKRIDLQHLR